MTDHVWVVYEHDCGPYAISVHDTCEAAVRVVGTNGYGKVARWSFGTELADAIRAWESGEG